MPGVQFTYRSLWGRRVSMLDRSPSSMAHNISPWGRKVSVLRTSPSFSMPHGISLVPPALAHVAQNIRQDHLMYSMEHSDPRCDAFHATIACIFCLSL